MQLRCTVLASPVCLQPQSEGGPAQPQHGWLHVPASGLERCTSPAEQLRAVAHLRHGIAADGCGPHGWSAHAGAALPGDESGALARRAGPVADAATRPADALHNKERHRMEGQERAR